MLRNHKRHNTRKPRGGRKILCGTHSRCNIGRRGHRRVVLTHSR